jgi:hypothetical protein
MRAIFLAYLILLDSIVMIVLYLVKSTSYEAPHHAVFSNLLYLIRLKSKSAPCTQASSVCVLYLISETKFHAH